MRRLAIIAALGTMTFAGLPAAQANASNTQNYFNYGFGTTGFNRQLGVPIWAYPNLEPLIALGFPPQVVLAGFRTSGRYDPALGEGGGNSLAWSPADSMNELIATHYDADFLPLIGTPPFVINDVDLNVHLDNVKVVSSSDGIGFSQPGCADDSTDASDITKAFPCDIDGMTVGEYISAAGWSHFECRADGTARVRIWGWNMRPNRMYSTWYVKEDIAFNGELINGVPFGGMPNIVVTNKWGTAYMDREVNYCPATQDDSLGYVFALRANGSNVGGIPTVFTNQTSAEPFSGYDNFFPGGNLHVHVSWNTNGVPFDPANPPF